jgi:hypothetical protein
MTVKICNKCKIEKPLNNFPFKNKEKGYLMPYCSPCNAERRKNIKKNPDNKNISNKHCSKCNIDKLTNDFYFDKSKDNFSSECKLCMSNRQKNNRHKINERRKIYKSNPEIRIKENLQTRLYSLVKKNQNSNKLSKYLGCSKEFFINWIKSQLYGRMTIDNYGKIWHIDHCKPCKSFDFSKEEQIKECFSWKNMRPLYTEINLTKGSSIFYYEILLQELKVRSYLKYTSLI